MSASVILQGPHSPYAFLLESKGASSGVILIIFPDRPVTKVTSAGDLLEEKAERQETLKEPLNRPARVRGVP